jgi:disulfide bond formation protein DsbB
MYTLYARAPLVILIVAVAVLGGAFAFQYLGGLAPCELCLLQRWPWGAVIVFAAVAIFVPAARRPHLFLCALALLIGAGIAAYHVGVEHHWIAGPEACTGGPSHITSIDELRRKLLATQAVRCDEPAWSMLGISMAGYNAVISLVLAAFSLAAGARAKAS